MGCGNASTSDHARWKKAAFCLTLLGAVLVVVSSALASPKPRGVILIADANGYLSTINPDMTNQRTLVVPGSPSPLRPGQFSLSTDATKIALGGCSCAAGLVTVNTDGSDFFPIPNTTYFDTQPDWSPDGTKLVFIHDVPSFAADIEVMNPDGTNVVDLTKSYTMDGRPFYASDPQWSPDGKSIVFWGGYSGPHLYLINADGSGFRQLTFDNDADTSPRWSPDGKWIAFARWDYNGLGISHITRPVRASAPRGPARRGPDRSLRG